MPTLDPLTLLLVDKILLGIVVAGGTFFFGRALERYRLAGAYAQKLAERRLAAYDILSEHLFAEMSAVSDLTHRLEGALASASLELDQAKSLSADLRAFTTSNVAPPPRTAREFLFFSPDVGNAYTNYALALGAFKNFLRTHQLNEDSLRLFQEKLFGLGAVQFALQKALSTDVSRPPAPHRSSLFLSSPSKPKPRPGA